MSNTTHEAVTAAVAAGDPWSALEQLAREQPADLLPAVRRCYSTASSEERRRLSWLLRLVDGGAELMLELLPGVSGGDAADLLRELTRRGTPVGEDQVVRLLADPAAQEAAVVAASSWPALAPAIAEFLDTPRLRRHAAITLGSMRATAYTDAIVTRLPSLDGPDHAGFVTALELMGDSEVVPPLLKRLAEGPREKVWDIHHALTLLTGHDPLIPLPRKPERWASAVQQAWAGWQPGQPSPPPRVEVGKLSNHTQADLSVHNGLGQFRVDHDPPLPGSTWPRWNRSLRIAGERVYHVGSQCGTCETVMSLLGWPGPEAARVAGQLRDELDDVAALTPDLIGTVDPLLCAMPSGHYQLTLVDLDLEYVTEEQASWWYRRVDIRDPEEAWPVAAGEQWPGVDHFQLRTQIPDPTPTYASVLPTQPPDTLSAATVDRYRGAIAAGRRPAAVLLGWAQHRWIEANDEEQYLVGVILDGHHKLHAYAAQEQPARALLICRVEDSDGPTPWPPAAWLRTLTAKLRAARS